MRAFWFICFYLIEDNELSSLTVAIHTAAFKLALEPHRVEASENAYALKFALNKFTFVPEKHKRNPQREHTDQTV